MADTILISIPLNEYKQLLVENTQLKGVMTSLKRKISESVKENIYENQIFNIKTRAEVLSYLSMSDEQLRQKFYSRNYSWNWEELSKQNYDIASPQRIKDECAAIIKKMLEQHLGDLDEDDDEKKEGE